VDYLRPDGFGSLNVYEGILSFAKKTPAFRWLGALPVRSPLGLFLLRMENKPLQLSAEAHFGQRRLAVAEIGTPHMKPLSQE
jgi:hypothetical protein